MKKIRKSLLLFVLLLGFFMPGKSVSAKHYANMEEMVQDLASVILLKKSGNSNKTFKEDDYEIIPYEDIMRKREGLVDKKHTFYAEVQQYNESEELAEGLLMRNGNLDEAYYAIYPNLPDSRLMKGDTVDVYGTLYGLYTYTTVLGGGKTVPVIIVDKVLVQGVDY